jgi:hypothetical protein
MVDNPHFRIPFNWAKGGVPVVEQGSRTEIQQNAEAVLLTEIGDRAGLPDFGISDQSMLQDGANLGQLEQEVRKYEDRVVTEASHQGVIKDAVDHVRVMLGMEDQADG